MRKRPPLRLFVLACLGFVAVGSVAVGCGGGAAEGSAPQASASAKTDEAAEALAREIDPGKVSQLGAAAPASTKKTAPSVAEAQTGITQALPEGSATAPGDLHAWDNPQARMKDRGQIIVSAIAVLEAEREAGRCQAECLMQLATAYGFISGMHDLDRETAALLLGDPDDAELTAYSKRLLEEGPQQLRSVLAATVRSAPKARPTLRALTILQASATRNQQFALVEHIERYIMAIDPHPAIEHQLAIAQACYRDARLPCARSAIEDMYRIEKATGAHPSTSFDTLQRVDEAVVALSALAGKDDLKSLLRTAELSTVVGRKQDARTAYRTAMQKFPEDARAYMELTQLEHDNLTYLQLFELVSQAGRENRTPELYKTAAGLWIGGTMRAYATGEFTSPWLTHYARARDLATAASKLPPEESAGMSVLGVAIDTVAVLVRQNGTESQLAESLARSADTWDLNELRLRLVQALVDPNHMRATKTIAVVEKRDAEGSGRLARKAQLARAIALNDVAMLTGLERAITRLPQKSDEDNVMLVDVRAARAGKAGPFLWKKIADQYRALPQSANEDEQRRRAHNLAVADWKTKPKAAPYAVEEPPVAGRNEPPSGPGMAGVVCRRRVSIDVNPLVTGDPVSEVVQIQADVWLVEK